MAMVHTPTNVNVRPHKNKKRPSLENQKINSPSSTPSLQADPAEALLKETSSTIKNSIYLLNQTRSTRAELRSGLTDNLEKLERKIKEIEELFRGGSVGEDREKTTQKREMEVQCELKSNCDECNCHELLLEIFKKLREQLHLNMKEVRDFMGERMEEYVEKLNERITNETKKDTAEVVESYAAKAAEEVVKTSPSGSAPTTVHSLAITDKENYMTGQDIVNSVGKIIDAKKEGFQVERIRKGKGRKVLIGFRDKNERDRAKRKLVKCGGEKFEVETVRNKDPQIILYGVLKSNTDDDICDAIRNQNKHLIQYVLDTDEDRVRVKYRRKGRDPHTEHVILEVSPNIWQCFTKAGRAYIDMQRVRVADQSPLIQCSHCLGYGHGRRFCTESATQAKCGHCSGPHQRSECEGLKAGVKPCCINCKKEDKDAEHSAFSMECPIRRKWDAIARAAVAYEPEDEEYVEPTWLHSTQNTFDVTN